MNTKAFWTILVVGVLIMALLDTIIGISLDLKTSIFGAYHTGLGFVLAYFGFRR